MKVIVNPTRKSTQESGTGSEFLVLSNLFRIGINAFLSFGNTKQIDIIIKAKNGLALTVDVKAVRDYSSIPVNNVTGLENHYIVVVVYKRKFEDLSTIPDYYIIPSLEIVKIHNAYKQEKRLLTSKIAAYKNKWDYLAI